MGSGYVAKAIDLDISMFKNSLLSNMKLATLLNEVACSRDSDCNFNSLCLGQCDLATGKCTGNLNSNNLMVSQNMSVVKVFLHFSILHDHEWLPV